MWLARKRGTPLRWERSRRELLRRRAPTGDEVPEVGVKDFHIGTCAETCAARYCFLAVQSHGRTTGSSLDVKVASLCSGSEMLVVATKAAGQAIQAQGISVNFECCLLCEVVASKREWGAPHH